MGDFKDTNGKSRIGKWLKDNAPQILETVGGVLPDAGALGIVKNLISKDATIREDKKLEAFNLIELDLKAFELEIKDRERATDLYKTDSSIQKFFAITFLIGYLVMTGVMFYGSYQIAVIEVKLDNYLVSLITAIFTAMSTKVNTITDFLFGGSFKN